jgi:16S rRNA (cytosine967-C5)-methyltransferase
LKPTSPSPARDAALAAVTASLGPDRFDLQAALHFTLERQGLDARDAGLATELAYGFLRLKGRTDYVLSAFLKDPDKLPYDLKLALGLAAFELIYLDKSPAHAVVNWVVGAVKTRFGDGLAKLANAVSRRVADLGQIPRHEAFYRKGAVKEADFLSRWLSCPRFIVEALLRELGSETTTELLAAQVAKPPLGLRCNATRPEAKSVYDDLSSQFTHQGRFPTLALDPAERPARLAELEASGLLSRQSAASQLILRSLEPDTWPGPIVDVCAGRGGKTCLLLEAGLPVMAACDVSRNRLMQLGYEFDRLGLPRIPRILADAAAPNPWRKRPGAILIDAPCTGLGVLARRPDSKWKRSRADTAKLATLQSAILSQSYDALAPGGRLAFVTCTLLRAENEGQIENLVRNNPGARVLIQEKTPLNLDLNEFFFGALIEKT